MSKFYWMTCSIVIFLLTIIVAIPFTRSVLSQSSGVDTASKRNFDPLSEDEQHDVVTAALAEVSELLQPTDYTVQAASSRTETLLVERHEESKSSYKNPNTPRRGDAYIYDYASDTLIRAIINLETGVTDEIIRSQGVQLPLTQNEIERAITLAYANNTFRQTVEKQYREITGGELYSLDQLEVRAFVFHADSMIGNVLPAAESCGINRCAQLLLYTSVEDIAFEIVPVINLSTSLVLPEARAQVETATSPLSATEYILGGGASPPMLNQENGPVAASINAASVPCSGDYLINETLATGARWELCWSHSPESGVVLSDIHFSVIPTITRKIMAQANLAQIHTVYNDNSSRNHYVTDSGLGGANLVELDATDCPNGQLRQHAGQNVFCLLIEDRGHIYRHQDQQGVHQRQGSMLRLFSVSDVGSQNFIVQWDLYDDGTIIPAIGSTGILSEYSAIAQYGWPLGSSGSTIGVGYVNNYYWRLDFDIAGNGANDVVEEFNVNPTALRERKTLSVTQIISETARSVDTNLKRSWRVRDDVVTNSDNHKVSYHLEPMWIGNRYVGPTNEPWTHHDIYFTQDNPCELYASHNPQVGGCGENVADFTNNESIDVADIVVWYSISYRHLPRAEDEPYILTHWDSFQLLPRDWTAVSFSE